MNKRQAEIQETIRKGLKKRYRAERRFRYTGVLFIFLAIFALSSLFFEIVKEGSGVLRQSYVVLDVRYEEHILGISNPRDENQLAVADFGALVKDALKQRFPEVKGRRNLRELYALMSIGATFELRDELTENPALMGTHKRYWLLADDEVDIYFKEGPDKENSRSRLSDKQRLWVDELASTKDIRTQFNRVFFTSGDSAEGEMAGVWGALVGSGLTLLVTMLLSLPIGVGAAIYLEEYAPRNRLTDFLEVNINNLAAVPSIIYGLLGLAIFINLFGMPRSIPLVGGLVLTLMTLPTIIISSRAAIAAVPYDVREAAFGMGASKMQVIMHHILPLAMPGILTGAIIGMAQALGETAPLLMIGMVAFIADIPSSVSDPSTVLPVQIFLWSDSPDRSFIERTSAAIFVLLFFLILMNGLAAWLRRRLERR